MAYGQTVQITIHMEGQAFYPEPHEQVYSILDGIQQSLVRNQDVVERKLLDDNGNRVGSLIVFGDPVDPDEED